MLNANGIQYRQRAIRIRCERNPEDDDADFDEKKHKLKIIKKFSNNNATIYLSHNFHILFSIAFRIQNK